MCELPNYQSKKGHIYAVSKNGTEVPLKIKGINWFGMETYVPHFIDHARITGEGGGLDIGTNSSFFT